MTTQLASPAELVARLRRTGYRLRKRLGQHFLSDEATLARIVEATGCDEESLAVEIGPGPGTLTTMLARGAGAVLAIERDERLDRFHGEQFGADASVGFHYADALTCDLQGMARKLSARNGLKRCVLTGNLPFQITSPLLFRQLGPSHPWSRIVVMVQREVADRITSPPNSRDYGILTVKLAYWWRVVDRFEVQASMFTPPPEVNAAVVRMDRLEASDSPTPEEWPALSRFIDLAFNQRRKKLYNSPAALSGDAPGRDAIRSVLTGMGLNPDARPENLSPGEFLQLFRELRAVKPA